MKIDKILTLNESGSLEEIPVVELEKGVTTNPSESKDIKKNIKGQINNKNKPFSNIVMGMRKKIEKESISSEESQKILSSFYIGLKDLEKGYVGSYEDEYITISFIFKESWCLFKKLWGQRKIIKRRIKEFEKMKTIKC